MLGLMQSQSLLISSLIEFAERHHGDGEIVSRRVEGDIHRYTYRDLARRSRQVANALDGLGLQPSDRVATIAWNGYRHMELYFGVSGSGRVLHTINPRLHPDQVAWIVNHAEDKALCFDMSFLPLVQAVHAHCPTVKQWVASANARVPPAASALLAGRCTMKTRWPSNVSPVCAGSDSVARKRTRPTLSVALVKTWLNSSRSTRNTVGSLPPARAWAAPLSSVSTARRWPSWSSRRCCTSCAGG